MEDSEVCGDKDMSATEVERCLSVAIEWFLSSYSIGWTFILLSDAIDDPVHLLKPLLFS